MLVRIMPLLTKNLGLQNNMYLFDVDDISNMDCLIVQILGYVCETYSDLVKFQQIFH